MVIQILKEWNPWWEDKKLLKNLEGRYRPDYQDLIDSIQIKEITILTGIRRSGKTTLMYQMIDSLLKKGVKEEQIFLVNLEDNKLSKTGLEEIYEAYRENINPESKAYIFLDEIHGSEGWESWIRKKYDMRTPDKFVISGSSSYLLKKEYSTLLTGRNLTFEVFPLSFKEFLYFKGISPNKITLKETERVILNYLKEYLKTGGFPEIFFKDETFKTKMLEQYFDDILYKDIIDRYNLNSQKVKNFVLLLMTNFTGYISLRNLRNSLGIAYDLIKDYLSYCKEAFLFFTLDHFSYSFKEQKTLPSKIYCIDNGLRNSVSFKFSKDEGKLIENLVLIELMRRDKEVFYWTGKGEVDFIVKEKDQSLIAMNVTFTDEIDGREIKSLLEFRKEFDKVKQMIILTKTLEKDEDGIKYIPVWKWLLESKEE